MIEKWSLVKVYGQKNSVYSILIGCFIQYSVFKEAVPLVLFCVKIIKFARY